MFFVLLVILFLVTDWTSFYAMSSLLGVCISGANGVDLLNVLMPQFEFFSLCFIYIIFITYDTYISACITYIAFINIELVL